MNNIFFFTALLLCLNITAKCQTFLLTKENSCFFRGMCNSRTLEAACKLADPQTVNFVKQVLSKVSLSPQFSIYAGNLPDQIAVAKVGLSNKRIIIVDEKAVEKIRKDIQSSWPSVFIIAHECAHLLNSIPTSSDDEKNAELDADRFAGYVLYKMGASRSQALAALNSLDDQSCSDHPAKDLRINAAVKGWQQAADEKNVIIGSESSPSGFEELNAELTQNFKIKVIENPIDLNPQWDLVSKSISVNFAVENYVVSRPITSNQTFNIQLNAYNGKPVIWFNPFVTCNCIADIKISADVIVDGHPQTFRLSNFRKLAENIAGGPCMGLSNMYFAGGWSGKITLSTDRKGNIFMDLVLEAFRSGGSISYRYIANQIQAPVTFIRSR